MGLQIVETAMKTLGVMIQMEMEILAITALQIFLTIYAVILVTFEHVNRILIHYIFIMAKATLMEMDF